MSWESNLLKYELDFWVSHLKRNTYKGFFKDDHLSLFIDYFRISLYSFYKSVVLDIGSGPVSYLHSIKAKVKIAVDPLMSHYEKLTKNFVFPNEVIKLEGQVEKLPFIRETFDDVFAFNGIDHWEDWQKGILEIKRVLKKNGRLLVYVVFDRPNKTPHHPHNINENSIKWIEKQEFKIIQSKIYLDKENGRKKFFGIFKKLK